MNVLPKSNNDVTSLCMIGLGEDKYDLNMRELLRGDAVRLRYTRRYSTCRVNQDETVAEHSYYVGLYAAFVGQWVQRHPQLLSQATGIETYLDLRINWEKLMVRAMVHDMEESRTGDMPRFFKYSSPKMREVCEEAAYAAFKQIVEKLVSPVWGERLTNNWMLAKDNTLEGKIVAFADFLSVLSFVTQEVESGNTNAHEHITSLRDYFRLFSDSGFNPLRELVDQVEPLLEETFQKEHRQCRLPLK